MAGGWRQVGPRRRCHTCGEILSLVRGFWSQWASGKENRYYCARCYLLAVEAEAEKRQRERGGG